MPRIEKLQGLMAFGRDALRRVWAPAGDDVHLLATPHTRGSASLPVRSLEIAEDLSCTMASSPGER